MKKIPEIKYHKTRKDYYLYLDRKYTYLGKTLEEFERRRILLADFLLVNIPKEEVIVADLCARFLEVHQNSTTFYNYQRACKHLLETHRMTLISDFGPNALRQTREAVLRSGNVSRQYANKIISLTRFFHGEWSTSWFPRQWRRFCVTWSPCRRGLRQRLHQSSRYPWRMF